MADSLVSTLLIDRRPKSLSTAGNDHLLLAGIIAHDLRVGKVAVEIGFV
jgi:hypothetical protein